MWGRLSLCLYHQISMNKTSLCRLYTTARNERFGYWAAKENPTRATSQTESPWPSVIGRFLGTTGWDPSVCKSNRLYIDIPRFSFFIYLGYILQIPLKWPVVFLQSWTSTGNSSNSTGLSATNSRFSPIIGDHSTSSTLIGGKGGAGPSRYFPLCLRDQQIMRMLHGCKVYMDFYMASNGSCSWSLESFSKITCWRKA